MTHNLTGQRFGKLLVIHLEENKNNSSKSRKWRCVCDCGGECTPTTTNLRNGNSKACGNCRPPSNSGYKHGATAGGGSFAPTYRTWASMKYRVKHKPEYAGVSIDPNWVASFEAFVADMGERPNGTTLDRRDNAKGYCKENCRWATPTQQTRNRRMTKLHTIGGVTLPVGEWAERLGLEYDTALYRLKTHGSLRLPKNAV